MLTRIVAVGACFAFTLSLALAAEDERKLVVQPSKLFPIESVAVYRVKDGKRQVVVEAAKFDKPLTLPDDGPFVVMVKPKGGIAVEVLDKLTVKAGKTHELKLAELVGSIEVVSDNLPRAEKIVVTDVRDSGPGEKGHVALQWAKEYRVEMVIPPGQYAVWVVPDNGAKAQRIADNVRVQAGRNIRVGD